MGRPAKHPPIRKLSNRLELSREGRSGRGGQTRGSITKDGRPFDTEGHADRPGQPVETHRAFNEERVPSVPSYRRYRPARTMLIATGRNIVAGELHDHRLYGLPSGRMVIVHTIMEMEVVRAPRPC